jgi:uncharacterized coiled-coil protein SlyX
MRCLRTNSSLRALNAIITEKYLKVCEELKHQDAILVAQEHAIQAQFNYMTCQRKEIARLKDQLDMILKSSDIETASKA